MKIGIFDSGIGGTTIFNAIKSRLKDAHEYYYLADSKNCPYGEKSDDELMTICRKNVETLKNWGARVIVIACNTATTKCIENLRREYKGLKFVGTEPAIKLAADSGAKNILVLATPGTIRAERTLKLVEDNQKTGQNIDLLECPGLADVIEKKSGIAKKLNELFRDAPKNYDAVVLGCTHYPLIKSELAKFFPNATMIDGAEGVARRTEQIVSELEKN